MRLLVYGAGALGRLIRREATLCGHEFEGFVDDTATGPGVLGAYDHVRDRLPPAPGRGVVVAIGYTHMDARRTIAGRLREDGYALPALTHPTAWVHPEATLGEGALLGARATVDGGARIGPVSVLWPGVIVSHDVDVGANTWLSPGAIVCGFAQIGGGTFIGAGAIVPDSAIVSAESFVRAGTVTRRSAP